MVDYELFPRNKNSNKRIIERCFTPLKNIFYAWLGTILYIVPWIPTI